MKRLAGVSSAIVLLAVGMASAQQPPIITNVRAAIAKQDFGEAERLVAAHRAANGVTPPMLEALSWISRGALAAKQGPKAEALAQQAYDLGVAALKGRTLDAEPHLPVAIGAAIEVLAKAAAERGARADAVSFLQRELATFANTSIHTRIQKNLNLLSLEGTPAPELDLSEHIGKTPPTLASLRGKVTLLFFWAHWCSDCKAQGPVVASLMAKYASQGLVVVAPTQRYGYVAGGKAAAAADETRYIAEVQRASYPGLAQVAVPVSDRNHKRYGVSTTPTLVVVDRKGIVRLYNPGQMSEQALDPLVKRLLSES